MHWYEYVDDVLMMCSNVAKLADFVICTGLL